MRASEVLGMPVVNEQGRTCGRVLDIMCSSDRLSVTALLVGAGPSAVIGSRIGLVQDRLQGPWPLRVLLSRGGQRVRRVAAADVLDWGPPAIRTRAVDREDGSRRD